MVVVASAASRVAPAGEATYAAAKHAVHGYCAAVRGALADEGKAPLEPGGLRLHERLEAIDASLEPGERLVLRTRRRD